MKQAFCTRLTTLACLLVGATWSLGASAQYDTLETTDDGYEVKFEDGALLGDFATTMGSDIRIRTAPPRVLLIRPRASFVSEMLKSVEDM
jgi:hypothetical protein